MTQTFCRRLKPRQYRWEHFNVAEQTVPKHYWPEKQIKVITFQFCVRDKLNTTGQAH